MQGLRSVRHAFHVLRLDSWATSALLLAAIVGGGFYHTYTIETAINLNTDAIRDLEQVSRGNAELLRMIREDQEKAEVIPTPFEHYKP